LDLVLDLVWSQASGHMWGRAQVLTLSLVMVPVQVLDVVLVQVWGQGSIVALIQVHGQRLGQVLDGAGRRPWGWVPSRS
jgi:hypothetical protein